jgi:hypothetical protein
VSDKRPLSSLNDADHKQPGQLGSVSTSHGAANQILTLFCQSSERAVDWNTRNAVKSMKGDSNRNRSISENAVEVVKG